MRSATSVPTAFAPLHDELVLEAGITLRTALARLEQARERHEQPGRLDAARRESIELIEAAGELLRRADYAAVGVHEVGS